MKKRTFNPPSFDGESCEILNRAIRTLIALSPDNASSQVERLYMTISFRFGPNITAELEAISEQGNGKRCKRVVLRIQVNSRKPADMHEAQKLVEEIVQKMGVGKKPEKLETPAKATYWEIVLYSK